VMVASDHGHGSSLDCLAADHSVLHTLLDHGGPGGVGLVSLAHDSGGRDDLGTVGHSVFILLKCLPASKAVLK
jgi:hypothetical protein